MTTATATSTALHRGTEVATFNVGDAIPMDEHTYAVHVSPALAQDWLNRYADPDKRAVRSKRVDEYAASMKSGGWLWGTATIAFTVNGGVALDNGHHRLNAIVKAGVPVWMMVVTGAEPAIRNVTDVGVSRTGGDAIRMWGGKVHANEQSSYIKMFLIYGQTVDTAIPWRPATATVPGTLTPPNAAIAPTWQGDRIRWESVALAMKNARRYIIKGIPPKTLGAFVYLAEVTHPGEGIKFLQDFVAGTHPELTRILTRLTTGRASSSGTQLEFDRKVMETLVRAFNANRVGKVVTSVPHTPFNLSRIK